MVRAAVVVTELTPCANNWCCSVTAREIMNSTFLYGKPLRSYAEGSRLRRPQDRCFGVLVALLVPFLVVGSSISEAQAEDVRGVQLEGIRGPIHSFAALDRGSCYSFNLRKQAAPDGEVTPVALGWTTSGFWKGAELHLADHTFSGLLRVFPGGLLRQHSVSLPVASADRPSLPLNEKGVVQLELAKTTLQEPQYVHTRPSGGFIAREIGENRVYFIDSDGYLERPYIQVGATFEDPNGKKVVLAGVKRSVPVRNGIFTLAEIRDWAGEPRTSFAYLDRASQKYHPIDVAALFSDPSESLADLRRKFYHLDFSYLAAIGDVAYALIMERRPWIARVDLTGLHLESPQVRRLELPASLGQYEKPSRSMEEVRGLGSRDAVIDWMFESYRAVEVQSVPVGLVAWNDKIHLLQKGASGPDGGTTWRLVELLAAGERRLGQSVELPTNAAHIAVVPGDEYFAVLEKGGIETLDLRFGRILYRPTKSALLLPVSWLSTSHGNRKTGSPCEQIIGSLN